MEHIDNKILSVSRDVNWVGVLDYDIVTFDIVMETQEGTTYNSYFINANKKITFYVRYGDYIARISAFLSGLLILLLLAEKLKGYYKKTKAG